MSDLIRFADARRQSRGELHAGWLDGGELIAYSGTVPASADVAITSQVELVAFPLADPVGVVTDGVLVATTIDAQMIAESGVPTFARAYDALGGVIADYDVGLTGSGAAVQINSLNLIQGGYVTLTAFSITEG